jgi:hypothetical protein
LRSMEVRSVAGKSGRERGRTDFIQSKQRRSANARPDKQNLGERPAYAGWWFDWFRQKHPPAHSGGSPDVFPVERRAISSADSRAARECDRRGARSGCCGRSN